MKMPSTKNLAIVVAFVILVAVIAVLGWQVMSKEGSENSNSETTSSNSSMKTDTIDEDAETKQDILAKSKIVPVGTEMTFATIKAKINSVRSASTISTSNPYSDPEAAGDGAVFVVVNLTQTNITSTPFTYREFILIDENGKNYSPFNAIGSIDNYMDVRELSPDIPETGNAVYRVPASVKKLYIGGNINGQETGIYTEMEL